MMLGAIVVLFLMVLVQVSTGAQIPLPKDCSRVDLLPYTKKCCTKPIGDLALANHLKMCNGNDKALNLWINNYMMHKLQDAKNEQALNLTSANNKKMLCKVAKFINCVFNYHKIVDNATYTVYNGTAARAIINQTKLNRTHWEDPLEIVEYEDIMQIIAESWNRTVSCENPLKKAEAPKDVFIGNVYLMQYFHIHLVMTCEYQAAPNTTIYTKNKCATHESNFYYCLDKVQESFNGKRKMQLPNWLKTLNAKDLNILNTHMQLLRSKFA